MNKKQLIQIIVIVCAFGASGLVLYYGLPHTPAASPTAATVATDSSGESPADILPYGASLDFSQLTKRFTFDSTTYPTPGSSDVGVAEYNLIPSQPVNP